MRNLKKVLSLALAFVMLMGLMIVGAGAAVTTTKDYADGADVTYTEAVDVMSAIGVFDGANGSFAPKGDLTRAQAAKIITYMLLGQEAADKLGTLTAPYTDVAASYWAAGSIAYCTNMGIVSGIGNGQFGPDAQVTGYQFAKMLLVALGYDADREGLTGSDWTINVSKLAITAAGLDTGIGNVDISLDKALTREEACQMAFNTLKATMVEYGTESTSITVGGTPIVIGGSNATAVKPTNQTYSTHFTSGGIGSNGTVEFGERYFQNLYCNSDADDMGRPAHTWQVGRDDIGTYAATSTFVYTADCTKGGGKTNMENELKSYTYGDGAPIYVNGKFSGTATSVANIEAVTGNGVLVEVFATDTRVITKVVAINTYLMTIRKIASDEVTLIKIGSEFNGLLNTVDDKSECFAPLAAMAVNDYVLVTPVYVETDDHGDDVYNVAAVGEPQSITGALTRVDRNAGDTVASSVTVAGSSYSLAANNTAHPGDLALADLTSSHLTAVSKKDAVLYLDNYGYAVLVKNVETNTNYIYVTSTYQALIDNRVVTMVVGLTTSGEVVELNAGSPTYATNKPVEAGKLYIYQAPSANDSARYGCDYDIVLPGAAVTERVEGVYHATGALTTQITAGATTLDVGADVPYANDVKFIYVDTDGTAYVRTGVQTVTGTAISGGVNGTAEENKIGVTAVLANSGVNNVVVVAVFVEDTAPADGAGSEVLYLSEFAGYQTNDRTTAIYKAYLPGDTKDTEILVKGGANNLAGNFYTFTLDDSTGVYSLGSGTYSGTGTNNRAIANGSADQTMGGNLIRINGNYLRVTSETVFVDLCRSKISSVQDVQDALDAGNAVTVSVLYNDSAAAGASKNNISYLYVVSMASSANTITKKADAAIASLTVGSSTITLPETPAVTWGDLLADLVLPAGASYSVSGDKTSSSTVAAGDVLTVTSASGAAKTYTVSLLSSTVSVGKVEEPQKVVGLSVAGKAITVSDSGDPTWADLLADLDLNGGSVVKIAKSNNDEITDAENTTVSDGDKLTVKAAVGDATDVYTVTVKSSDTNLTKANAADSSITIDTTEGEEKISTSITDGSTTLKSIIDKLSLPSGATWSAAVDGVDDPVTSSSTGYATQTISANDTITIVAADGVTSVTYTLVNG